MKLKQPLWAATYVRNAWVWFSTAWDCRAKVKGNMSSIFQNLATFQDEKYSQEEDITRSKGATHGFGFKGVYKPNSLQT